MSYRPRRGIRVVDGTGARATLAVVGVLLEANMRKSRRRIRGKQRRERPILAALRLTFGLTVTESPPALALEPRRRKNSKAPRSQ